MRLCPPRPEFPDVPTTAMPAEARRKLADALQACRTMMSWPGIQAHVKRGYAFIWIHLAMERHLDPRKTIAPTSWGYQDILKAFLKNGSQIGLHDRTALGWHAPDVALLAAKLWQEAKDLQAAAAPLLPGLDLSSPNPAKPDWLKAMKPGGMR